ncbi:hypothetical protein [Streptomyces sp. NBC_01294]|uniref:hypothetical protein n=1 Tax=Streptomyces sp. NBC_01294 TaxID=2903815 RepID=UPI002DDBBA6E|nr:hypothetical protein [Streptomyces sp. NBC_01294]WRZ61609.1 hypothetical protein OG534_37200 [Streptomyces sp. NBC_01294]
MSIERSLSLQAAMVVSPPPGPAEPPPGLCEGPVVPPPPGWAVPAVLGVPEGVGTPVALGLPEAVGLLPSSAPPDWQAVDERSAAMAGTPRA